MDFAKRITTQDAAKYLGVSTSWLLEKLDSKKIPYYRPANRYFFVKEELDQWLLTTRCKTDYRISGSKTRKKVVLF